MPYLDDLLIGLILSGGVGALAYRRGALSVSGVGGAIAVGTLIFGLGGWAWGLTLITFFASSSALSRYKEAAKQELAAKFAKGHRRDLGQTLANGGAGALVAVLYAWRPEPVLLAAFVGAMAAVTADTWATELGVLSAAPPRLITTRRPVEVGTSGGVSRLGTAASFVGALVIGLAAWGFSVLERLLGGGANPWRDAWLVPAALIGGLSGSLTDSLLGASLQAIYHCPVCAVETEKKLHGCGTATVHQRGWRWLDNDGVNFISALVGALVASGLYRLL